MVRLGSCLCIVMLYLSGASHLWRTCSPDATSCDALVGVAAMVALAQRLIVKLAFVFCENAAKIAFLAREQA